MQYWFAPLEGITDAVFRRIHAELFPGIQKYYMPFVSPSQHLCFTSRQQRDLAPEENKGLTVIPQVLTKSAEQFLWSANALAEIGYTELDLNLGCPSGTVTAKGKGSGMLRDLDGLRAFLDEVFSRTPLPISIKTRVGFDSVSEWPRIKDILCAYPLHALIVHPRTRQEFYRGQPHTECLAASFGAQHVVYNGNIFSKQDVQRIGEAFPWLDTLMLGRGLIANPALAREAAGGPPLSADELYRFHQRLLRAYCDRWPENAVLGHMREILRYMLQCFEADPRFWRSVRKVKSVQEYEGAVEGIFASGKLREVPAFTGGF